MVTEISNPFKGVEKIMKMNPLLQFAQKAVRDRPVFISQMTSPIAVGSGLGQEFSPADRQSQRHFELANRSRIFFNMMRFDFNQRS